MNRLALLTCLAVSAVTLTACPDNPYKASTWTKKLSDPREAERAVTQLENLGDPSAIPALGEAWIAQGKPVRVLQVIISLAPPLTPEQAKATFKTDYEATGRPASWDAAMPFLKQALTEVDETNPRSVDSAQKAADAVGESQVEDGLDALIDVASKPVTKKLIGAQVSAIRAIGRFDNAKVKASGALVKLIDKDPPINPRAVKGKDATDEKQAQRAAEEKYGLFLGVTGAAINALGDLRAPSAAKTLVLSMYRTPELFTQIRRALVACGPTAEDEIRKVLRDESPEVKNLFDTTRLGCEPNPPEIPASACPKNGRLDRYCGDKGDQPVDQCQKVSAHDFYPAVILGDFYDRASVPDLLAALDRPPAPQYFQDDQPSGSTQYNAIFDALRKIGSDDAAAKVRSMWDTRASSPPPSKGKPPKGKPAPVVADAGGAPDLMTRILAVGAYPFVTHDDTGVEDLGKIAADNAADDQLRTEAATAFSRLSHNAGDIKVLEGLAQKYFDASDKKRKEADGKPKSESDAADKDFEHAKKVLDDAKMEALKVTHDNSKTAEDIRNVTEAGKKAEDDFKVAKKKHKDATAPYKNLDAAAKAYKGYARMFQTHIARIAVAIHCKNDISCYAGTLKETPDEAAKDVSGYIRDIGEWTKDEKLGLLEGEVERAMLEIGKQGAKASGLTDTLLDAAKTDDRLIRQSILLALPKVATKPCNTCEQKLDIAIRAGEGKSTLGDLNLETTMLRNYFSWAGGKTPSSPSAAVPTESPAPTPAPAPKGKKK
ncbi:MAG TPA: hypothetical protein VGF94_26310 [Kofleriaceae bacterium]|jgi:hypothetical protein